LPKGEVGGGGEDSRKERLEIVGSLSSAESVKLPRKRRPERRGGGERLARVDRGFIIWPNLERAIEKEKTMGEGRNRS